MKTYPIGKSSIEEIEFRANESSFALVHILKLNQGSTQGINKKYKTIIMNEKEETNLFKAQIESGVLKRLSHRDLLEIYKAMGNEILKLGVLK